jgi:hypothetical protein
MPGIEMRSLSRGPRGAAGTSAAGAADAARAHRGGGAGWWAVIAAAALLGACNYHPRDYSPTAPGTAAALALTSSAASIPDDGFSVATITAQIDPAAAPDRRTIVFTTSAGTFLGATDNNGQKISMAADTAGKASVQLQSSRAVQTAIVDASISVGSQVLVDQRISVSFVAAGPSDLIALAASPDSAPADGVTAVHVIAAIAPGLAAGQRTVTFTTTLGAFADSQARTTMATADSSNHATVDLASPSAGQARVTGTVAQTSAQTTATFTPALPDSIIVSPDKPAIKASLDDSTTVTVTLLRSVGTVTKGTVVSYRVVDSQSRDLGFLIRSVSPSNDMGVSQAVVIAGNTSFRGTATIVATVAGASAVGQANLEVVNP